MLNISANVSEKSKAKVGFGTNLVVGQGVVNHLNTNPQELQQIQAFKDYLATDGKNWNAELTYDKFEPKENKEISLDETEKLIRKSAESYDWEAREKTSENISQMEPQKASDFIEKMVSDPDSKVASNTANMAGHIKDPKVAVALVEKLVQNPNPEIKESAIYALEYIKDESIIHKELNKYLNNNNSAVKKSVALMISKYGDSGQKESLIEKFNNDDNAGVRQEILYLITDIDDEKYAKNVSLYDSIIENGLKDPEKDVRTTAFLSVGKLSDSQKAAQLIGDIVFSDEGSYDKSKAAESAGYIKDSQLAKDLIEKLLVHPDDEVRSGAAEAVTKLADAKLQDELMQKVLNSSEVSVRRRAVWGLSDIKDSQKAIEYTEKLLKDTEPDIRESAAWHIAWIDDQKAMNTFITSHIKDSDLSIRKGIVSAVNYMANNQDSHKAEKFAKILTNDEDKYIQKRAHEILEKIQQTRENQDHYHLKITGDDKVIGDKVIDNKPDILKVFFNAYKAIFENNAD